MLRRAETPPHISRVSIGAARLRAPRVANMLMLALALAAMRTAVDAPGFVERLQGVRLLRPLTAVANPVS
jgi:hypothetical protein